MNGLCKKELGSEGLEHVRATLLKGGPIPSAIRPLEIGSAWAYLPCTLIEPIEVEAYQDGGIFSTEDAADIHDQVVLFIRSFLQSNDLNVVLFEDQFFGIDDPPNSTDQQLFKYRGTVYHYRTCISGIPTLDLIDDAISAASNYPQIIVLTRIATLQALPSRSEMAEDFANDLVKNVCHVVVGAFDEEGYLIWSSNED
jgi:hypothetical protein